MSVDPVRAALSGCCPKCGAGRLFAGLLRFAPRCDNCGLDYSQFNVGDGPAAFLTLIIGAIVTGLALWVELAYEPPFWVHIILWLPLVVVGTVAALRYSKAVLLALEYRHQATEGRLDRDRS